MKQGQSSTPAHILVDNLIPIITSLLTFWHNISELTSATSNERMIINIIFAGATPIN